MEQNDTFALGEMDVTVAETADALTYTFAPRIAGPRLSFLLILVVFFVLVTLGLLGVVGYALDRTGANRPEWELALTGVFAAQILVWLVACIHMTVAPLLLSLHPIRIVLVFTRTRVRHGDERVCELEAVRGLRLFLYTTTVELLADSPLPRTEMPPNPNAPPLPPELAPIPPEERPPPKPQASLSLVIGEEGLTHGLLGGFDPQSLRTFAEHLRRRLGAFRDNQGLLAPLDPLSVVETTEAEVNDLMHTRPPSGRFRGLLTAWTLLVNNRWAGIAWCVTMLAGVFGSGRLIVAAGLPSAFLMGHLFLGMMHFTILLSLLKGPDRAPEKDVKG